MELRHLRYFLRVALSDGITPSRLPALLAQCREEDPEVEVRLFEVPLTQQIKGLHDDLYDAGFSMAEDAGDGIVVTPAWEDELMVAVASSPSAARFQESAAGGSAALSADSGRPGSLRGSRTPD